ASGCSICGRPTRSSFGRRGFAATGSPTRAFARAAAPISSTRTAGARWGGWSPSRLSPSGTADPALRRRAARSAACWNRPAGQTLIQDIHANLEAVHERVARACERAGRKPDDVLLIAVSKTVEIERIRLAVTARGHGLGENRVQEAKDKVAALGRPVPWHLIGSLQTNKARDAVELFDWIHSVDREELARELDRRAHQRERQVKILVQVNVGEEPQKGGVHPG